MKMNWHTRGGYALTVAGISLVLLLPLATLIAGAFMRLEWPQHLALALATIPMILVNAVMDARGVTNATTRGVALAVVGVAFLAPTAAVLTGKDWINGLFYAVVITAVALIASRRTHRPEPQAH